MPEVFSRFRPTLENSMTRHPHFIRAGETLRTAELMLDKLKVHHLPVLDGGRLAGVITDFDLITETEGDTEPKLAGIFTLRDAARVVHNQLTLRL